jgi:predicted lactoylglutathione lyase
MDPDLWNRIPEEDVMVLQLGMVVLDVEDVERSIAFYRLLGLDVPDRRQGAPVTLHKMPSGITLVLAEGFASANDPGWVRHQGYQQALEFFVGSDQEVDAMWERLTTAGHHGRMAPRRTTGPYAAMVDDPDGNVLLLSSDEAANPAA